MSHPLISIITISYNAKTTIEETILSVINQSYKCLEYIIIDGGSTDGTIDIIKKYSDKITYWISEPDKGIYDAMNKGIKVSSGNWINFMNCGDRFYRNDILQNIFCNHMNYEYPIIYGDSILNNGYSLNYNKALPLSYFSKGMPFCHQSVFVSSNYILPFNINFKIAADYNYFYYQYKLFGDKIFKHIEIPVAVYDTENGISSSVIKTYNEYLYVRNEKYKVLKSFLFKHLYIVGKKIKTIFKL